MRYKYYLLSDWSSQPGSYTTTWPVEGRVEVLDWNPDPENEAGIFGFLQEPNASLLPAVVESENKETSLIKADSQWVVFGSNEAVKLDGQVAKCPWGMVLYCGDREGAAHFVELVKTDQVKIDYLGDNGSRKYMYIGKAGAEITTGEKSLVIGANNTSIQGGNRSTLIGGRCSEIVGGDRSIITGGKGAKVAVGNRATVAGGDQVKAVAGHSSTVVGGYKSEVIGGSLSTIVGGYKSTVTGGYGATVVGGDHAYVKGGDFATVIGGDDSWVEGGKNAQVFGGLRSKVSGGIDATLRIAYLNEKGEREITTGYVGRFGIQANVAYSFDGKFWIEV